jgi:hypothetical protein
MKLYDSIFDLTRRVVKSYDPNIEDAKQYLHEGEEPPEGAQVQEGPRGGKFVDTDGSRAGGEQQSPTQSQEQAPAIDSQQARTALDAESELGDDVLGDLWNDPKFEHTIDSQAKGMFDELGDYDWDWQHDETAVDISNKLVDSAAAKRLKMSPDALRSAAKQDPELGKVLDEYRSANREDCVDYIKDRYLDYSRSMFANPWNEDVGRGDR